MSLIIIFEIFVGEVTHHLSTFLEYCLSFLEYCLYIWTTLHNDSWFWVEN